MPLDLVALSVDAFSLLSLGLVSGLGLKAVRSFQQSRQAVVESASLLSVIVDALTSRMERTETALITLRSELATVSRRDETLQTAQTRLQSRLEEAIRQLQDVTSNDRRLIQDLEQLRSRVNEAPPGRQPIEGLPSRDNFAVALAEGDIVSSLTPTQRLTLEILRVEGSKGAPELAKRLEKSREHTARLMKKLYMEGFVKRESNRTPFRYKLNDGIRSALESSSAQATEERPVTP